MRVFSRVALIVGCTDRFTRKQFDDVQNMLAMGNSAAEVAALAGASSLTAYRIKQAPAKCEKALALWGGIEFVSVSQIRLSCIFLNLI